jgi:hypothetical protein
MGRVEEFKFPEGKIHYRTNRPQTADRGRQIIAGRAFQPVRETVNEWGNE